MKLYHFLLRYWTFGLSWLFAVFGSWLSLRWQTGESPASGVMCGLGIVFASALLMSAKLVRLSGAGNKGQLELNISVLESAHEYLTKVISDAVSRIESIAAKMNMQGEYSSRSAVAVREIVESVRLLSQKMNEQAGIVQSSSAAMEEMASATDLVAKTTQEADNVAKVLQELAGRGADGMREANEAILTVQESSNRMLQIVKAISSIANRTKLLALNASIEAARAGRAGKGFAVVAEEVKTLADQSNKSAEDIAEIIRKTVSEIHIAAERAVSANDGYAVILDSVSETRKMTHEISTAMSEQNSAAAQINNSLENLMRITRELQDSAGEQWQASHHVQQTVESFTQIADQASAEAEEISGKRFQMNDAVNRLGRIAIRNRRITASM